MTAVFDANIVVKWFVDGPLSGSAIEARKTWRQPCAPSLLTVEVANAFRRYVVRGDLDGALAIRNVALVPRIVRLIDHRDFLEEATRIAIRQNHSVQDCIYVAMAMHFHLPLITADEKLARKFADADGLNLHLIAETSEI